MTAGENDAHALGEDLLHAIQLLNTDVNQLREEAATKPEVKVVKRELSLRFWGLLALILLISLPTIYLSARAGANSVKKDQAVAVCERVNTKFVAPLRGLLETAQSSATRNPLPPGLSPEQLKFYEDARARQQVVIGEWLELVKADNCEALYAAGK